MENYIKDNGTSNPVCWGENTLGLLIDRPDYGEIITGDYTKLIDNLRTNRGLLVIPFPGVPISNLPAHKL